MAALGYTKLKRGLGLAFGAYFLHVFAYKCSFTNTILVDKVAISYLFCFLRYQIKQVIKFSFRKLMTS